MQYQIIIPENKHVTNIAQGEQGVLMHLELYVYIHVSMWQQLMRGEAMYLRENRE